MTRSKAAAAAALVGAATAGGYFLLKKFREQPCNKVTTVCCPGKILVAGGYLVLEAPNPGLVIGADGTGGSSRFFASVAATPTPRDLMGASAPKGYSRHPLDVLSPQFDTTFRYWLEVKSIALNGDDFIVRIIPRYEDHIPNPYVEKALSLTFAYIHGSLGVDGFNKILSDVSQNGLKMVSIKLRAGNDFYSCLGHLESRKLDPTPANVSALPQFLPCPKIVDDETNTEKVVVNKTGMGSSAALVTSVIGAILSHFGVVTLPLLGESSLPGEDEPNLRLVHNLAQICHCSAQGKVGSGFDVSAAVFGTHVFRRFSKSVLEKVLDDIEDANSEGSKDCFGVTASIANELVRIASNEGGAVWDAQTTALSLPAGLELLMADVCGGSESPSMARKILSWKKDQKEGVDNPWERLKATNLALESVFCNDFMSQTFRDALSKFGSSKLAHIPAENWESSCTSDSELAGLVSTLLKARELFKLSRIDLKAMGDAANVPVEPQGQTSLADATMALPGVVAAGVPGAGGYDALFVLYVRGVDIDGGKSDEVRERIGNLWKSWGDTHTGEVDLVCPLAVRGAGHGGGNFGICSSDLGW